jgi:hypothetical protein
MVSRSGHQIVENPGFDAGVLRCVYGCLAYALRALERFAFGWEGWSDEHLHTLHFLDVPCTERAHRKTKGTDQVHRAIITVCRTVENFL